jgi:hypothetical protein
LYCCRDYKKGCQNRRVLRVSLRWAASNVPNSYMQRLSLSSFLKDTSANPSSKVFATCIPCHDKEKKRRALQPLDPNKPSKRPYMSRPLPSSNLKVRKHSKLGAADRIYTGVKRSFFIYCYVTFFFFFMGVPPKPRSPLAGGS